MRQKAFTLCRCYLSYLFVLKKAGLSGKCTLVLTRLCSVNGSTPVYYSPLKLVCEDRARLDFLMASLAFSLILSYISFMKSYNDVLPAPVSDDKSAIEPTSPPMPPKALMPLPPPPLLPIPCCYMDAVESIAARGLAGFNDVKKLCYFS